LSGRRNGPFVPVNCAALPDTLLESELFGYKKGAFTDAVTDKKGRIALAEGGTLFLDEIGDISPAFQVKVLRFLQDHTYEPLGAQNTTRADVRILAATNQDLKKLVEKGSFREDLYYRINVVPIRLPPLRSRMEDIPLLVDHFIDRFNALYDKNVRGVSPDTLTLLMGYHYPGNVRELENAIEHAFVLIEGELILPRHLPEHIFFKSGLASGFEFTGDAVKRYQHMEAAFLSHLLAENGHDFRKTARILGVHKTTLYRKMHRLGLSSLLRGRRESAPTF
jgi:transcriptional regulator with PAS, ATPase and Fis domain